MEPLYGLSLELVRYAPVFFAISIAFFMAIGWYFGHFRMARRGGGVVVRDSLVAAIFGLSALVLGFTFSSASSHYDTRIEAVRTQAGSIKDLYGSTKYLRMDDQARIQKLLVELLDLRLVAYENIQAMGDIDHASNKVSALVAKIHEEVIQASLRTSPENASMTSQILMPQMNNLVTVF